MTLPGIDVSAIGQGAEFNWQAWAKRIAFAGIKATQGLDFRDPDFSRNMNGAHSIGAARMPYHFLDPMVNGAEQARFFLEYARPQPGELVMLDHESTGTGLAAAAVADCAADFADTVRAAVGAWPVCYSVISMILNGYCAGLGACPLFVANPSRSQLPPVLGPWRLVSFEQTGQRSIDTDVFYGTEQELARLAVLHPATPPAPQPRYSWRLDLSDQDSPKVLRLTSNDDGKTWHE